MKKKVILGVGERSRVNVQRNLILPACPNLTYKQNASQMSSSVLDSIGRYNIIRSSKSYTVFKEPISQNEGQINGGQ